MRQRREWETKGKREIVGRFPNRSQTFKFSLVYFVMVMILYYLPTTSKCFVVLIDWNVSKADNHVSPKTSNLVPLPIACLPNFSRVFNLVCLAFGPLEPHIQPISLDVVAGDEYFSMGYLYMTICWILYPLSQSEMSGFVSCDKPGVNFVGRPDTNGSMRADLLLLLLLLLLLILLLLMGGSLCTDLLDDANLSSSGCS